MVTVLLSRNIVVAMGSRPIAAMVEFVDMTKYSEIWIYTGFVRYTV